MRVERTRRAKEALKCCFHTTHTGTGVLRWGTFDTFPLSVAKHTHSMGGGETVLKEEPLLAEEKDVQKKL